MRRFAGAALGAGFAFSALVPLTILAGPAGAAAGRAGEPAGALGSTAAATASPTPSPSRPAKPPTGPPVPPPTPSGPPAPVRGMPQPPVNCLPQRGRTHLAGEPWAQRALDFSSVWDLTRGQHVTVAVVDSGIDYTPQLAGRVSRVDLTGGNGEDCIPHGTIVASIIAASDARARGIPFYGVAPAAHILSIRVQQQEATSGLTNAQRRKTLRDIADGIRYAAVRHAKVINVSIQVSASYPALRSAVEFALRRGAVVVAAAGNDNPGGSQGPFYPASYPGVLSVNAADRSGQLGGFDVNRTPVSVTAPGVNVASDYPGGFDPASNGTSFAAAFVSGEAALIRAAYPHMPAAQVVRRIIATAAGHTGAHTGAGMINPVQAVTAVLPSSPAPSPPEHLVPVPHPRAVNPYTRTVALSVTASALLTAALAAIGAVVIPQGRRRHWRPGGPLPAPASTPLPAGEPEADFGAGKTPRRSHAPPPTDGRLAAPAPAHALAPAAAPAPPRNGPPEAGRPAEAPALPEPGTTRDEHTQAGPDPTTPPSEPAASRARLNRPSRGARQRPGSTQPPAPPPAAPAPPQNGAPEPAPATASPPRQTHPLPPPDAPPPGPQLRPAVPRPPTIPAQPPPLPPDTPRSSPSQLPDVLPLVTYGVLPTESPQVTSTPGIGEFPAAAHSPAAPGPLPLREPLASPDPPPASPLPLGRTADQPASTQAPEATAPPAAAESAPAAPVRPPGARHRRRR
jgi:membrane-anchored mycosin MYCP